MNTYLVKEKVLGLKPSLCEAVTTMDIYRHVIVYLVIGFKGVLADIRQFLVTESPLK